MTKNLLIIGAGEFADIAYEYFNVDSDYTVAGFAVEAAYPTETTIFALPVVALETAESAFPPDSVEVHVAITSTLLDQVRERVFGIERGKGYRFANYVSSRAFVWRTAQHGGMRDTSGVSRIGWIDVAADDPARQYATRRLTSDDGHGCPEHLSAPA